MYRIDACDLPNSICGKEEIRNLLKSSMEMGLKIVEFHNLSVTVSDSIAVQKYYNVLSRME
ncbi:MAG: hypothetical protein HC906_19905 [Bacteroidales bacterium]|nr:hypothetical protein [Bacteroidales bacterium]